MQFLMNCHFHDWKNSLAKICFKKSCPFLFQRYAIFLLTCFLSCIYRHPILLETSHFRWNKWSIIRNYVYRNKCILWPDLHPQTSYFLTSDTIKHSNIVVEVEVKSINFQRHILTRLINIDANVGFFHPLQIKTNYSHCTRYSSIVSLLEKPGVCFFSLFLSPLFCFLLQQNGAKNLYYILHIETLRVQYLVWIPTLLYRTTTR